MLETALLLALGFVLGSVTFALGRRWWLRGARADAQKAGKKVDQFMVDQVREIEHLRAEIEHERRKRDEIFATVEGAVAEKRDAMNLYYQQAAEHSNAQILMLREIESVTRQYDAVRGAVLKAPTLEAAHAAAKRELRRNRALQLIADEFSERHVPPQPIPSAAAAGQIESGPTVGKQLV